RIQVLRGAHRAHRILIPSARAAARRDVQAAALTTVTHMQRGAALPQIDARVLVNEAPLTIDVRFGIPPARRGDGRADAKACRRFVIMRTPGQDAELAAGFLFTDGAEDIFRLEQRPRRPGPGRQSDRVAVWLRRRRGIPRRTLLLASSCGLCGRAGIAKLVRGLEPATDALHVRAERLYALPGLVMERQILFRQTGGSHAAALFDAEGNVLVLCEDIGRHNALDKALGHALGRRMPLAGKGIYLSGRASLEMIVKAARARVALVAAASAPSALAAELALRLGITLCGFVRGREITIYSRADRILGGDQPSVPASSAKPRDGVAAVSP
ncbi:MAG: formate dehydrogenase accessory sulfurtransferase FdhD, partial [bacterium]|nr:formate dehydrogenase accessory sulfurtransferase FdhD [bacterium]